MCRVRPSSAKLASWHHEIQDETIARQFTNTQCNCSWSHSGLSRNCSSRHPLRSHRRLPQLGAAATAEEGFQAQRRGQPAPHHHCCTALLVIWPGRPGCELPGQSTVFLALLCWYVLLSFGLSNMTASHADKIESMSLGCRGLNASRAFC